MQIEVLQFSKMGNQGSTVLRAIQNDETPVLDLLVRESIQNSLDAAIDGSGQVNVDFSVREIDSSLVATLFDGIQENLLSKYKPKSSRILEIRDTNTTGLTGPINTDNPNEFGNLMKLVFNVGIPQQKQDSGGSWGIGKTIYFRLGVGLVVYYTRIKLDDGRFESRLVASLIENEKSKDSLLGKFNNQVGIAWWGEHTDSKTVIPITNDDEINKILNILQIKPFASNETGTSIIVPFIKNDSELCQIKEVTNEQGETTKLIPPGMWWGHDAVDYIKVATQRWYFPRIQNQSYKFGRSLVISINSEILLLSEFLPAFKQLRALYDQAIEKLNHSTETINLRRTLVNQSAGVISHKKFSSIELKQLPPFNETSPAVQIFGKEFESGRNRPIVCYTRKPGMIVSYETNSEWTKGVPDTESNEQLLAIFVPNSNNKFTDEISEKIGYNTLESYLRGIERADHIGWKDNVKTNVVSRIQEGVSNKIRNAYKVENLDSELPQDIFLGKKLARFLPHFGFGKGANEPRKEGPIGPGGGSKPKKISINLLNTIYNQDGVEISFELSFPKKVHSNDNNNLVSLEIFVSGGEGEKIAAHKWESEEVVHSEFPVQIKQLYVEKLNNTHLKQFDELISKSYIANDGYNYASDIEITFNRSPRFKKFCGVEFHSSKGLNGRTIFATLKLEVFDPNVKIELKVEGGETQN